MTTLALIGIGRWGVNYINAIKSTSSVRIKYVCSIDKKSFDKIQNIFIKLDHYRKLFQYKDIDGIIIATPASTHFNISKDLLLKGYNILIEKPFTTNYKDAVTLKEIHESINSVVMVAHIYLYNPAFIKTRTLLKNIGAIKYLECEGSNWGPMRKDVSALWDWAPHDISMCLEILKEDPVEIQAWGVNVLKPLKKNVFDTVYIRLGFSHNVQAFIKIGILSPIKKRKITIIGSKSSVIFDDTRDKKIQLLNNKGINMKENIDLSNRVYPSYSNNNPLFMEIMEFANCIKTGKNPRSDLNLALRVSKIIHYVEQSIENKGIIIKYFT